MYTRIVCPAFVIVMAVNCVASQERVDPVEIQEIPDVAAKLSLNAAFRDGSSDKPIARAEAKAAPSSDRLSTLSTSSGEPVAESSRCNECGDLGVHCGLMRIYWSATFAATRFEASAPFGSFRFNGYSGLGHHGFGYMLTDHFELAGAVGGGAVKVEKSYTGVIDAHLKPIWHFQPRHRIDPYVGLKLGANTLVSGGQHLDFIAASPVVGVNYFLNRRVSIYGEVGYSYSHDLKGQQQTLQGNAVTGTFGLSVHFGK